MAATVPATSTSFLISREVDLPLYAFSYLAPLSLVWHACSANNTQKLEQLQLRALRFVYHDYASTYVELQETVRRPSLHLGRLRTLATEVYKSVHKLNPPYVQDIYKRKTTNHHLRGHETLHIPRVNCTTYGLHTSAYLGAKLWNCLPQTIKGAVTLSTFKTLVQSWYRETCKCAYCRVYYYYYFLVLSSILQTAHLWANTGVV